MGKESVACLEVQFSYSLVGTKMAVIRQLSWSYCGRCVEVRTRYFLIIDVVVNVALFSDVLFSGRLETERFVYLLM
jgi:hypothetical protein